MHHMFACRVRSKAVNTLVKGMLASLYDTSNRPSESHVLSYLVQIFGRIGVNILNVLVPPLVSRGMQDKRPRADGTVPSFRSDRKTTVGVEFATMVVTHPDGKRIKAQIWDTGG